MDWLISSIEPEALNAPILNDELLQSGIMREILNHLPWYKKTHKMDVILAGHLIHIIRSGFERTYVLRQMEALDIPQGVAERFLNILTERGYCVFGEPHYFIAPVQFVSSFNKGVAVQNGYGKRTIISDVLAECLRFLSQAMSREKYHEVLTEYLGKKEYAEQACQTLAHQGLLMSCSSIRTTESDYGVRRWIFEMERQGYLLSDDAWEERLHFLDQSFEGSYFQSRNYFLASPVGLSGNLETIMRTGDAAYFWELYFKLQRFAKQLPVNLKVSHASDYERCQELRLQCPTLFDWGITLDLRRRDSDRLIDELVAILQRKQFSYVIEVRLLLGEEWPKNLDLLNEFTRLKLYSTPGVQVPPLETMTPALRYNVAQSLKSHSQREGCGVVLSLYIDGQGGVYSCALEGSAWLGQIDEGALVIEEIRKSLRQKRTGACCFGANPDCIHGPVRKS